MGNGEIEKEVSLEEQEGKKGSAAVFDFGFLQDFRGFQDENNHMGSGQRQEAFKSLQEKTIFDREKLFLEGSKKNQPPLV